MRFRPPVAYPVLMALAGLLAGLLPGAPKYLLGGDLVLYVFVPAIVFEGTLGLDLAHLRRLLVPVAVLATGQVAVTVLVVAGALHWLGALAWPAAFIVGAILAATDPVAVLATLRQAGATGGAATLLEAESLFNDGTGVAVFTAVAGSALTGRPGLIDAGLRLVLVSVGAVAVGLAVGVAGLALLRRLASGPAQAAVELGAAYTAFTVAQLLGFAGVLAVVVTGLFAIRMGVVSSKFWRGLGVLLTAALFFLIGLALPTRHLLGLGPLVLLTFVAMAAARLPVYLVAAQARLKGLDRHLLYLGGVRGGLGIALALAVSALPGLDPRAGLLAYGAVALSLLVQATPLGLLAGRQV